jgi:hypothetical protein
VIPADAGRPVLRWLAVTVQLALVLWVARVYRIEELRQFDRLLPVVFLAFVAHSLVPPRFRVVLFVVSSWVGIGVVLGTIPAVWLVGTGLTLVGICRLPVTWGARVTVLVVAGTAAAAARAGRFDIPDDAALMLPILGSMFMIRMIMFAYDLRHGQEPKGWAALAYFFLLPNVCFPLFPAVDSRTFARSRGDSLRTVQKGVGWIARGVFQIVLYRLVYMHVLPAPNEVDGFWSLVVFTTGSYFIYIRISGIFHVAVGILCLFGFDLPETHHRYFASTRFTDVWHRINIYWTAFMTKVVYYPVMMKFRRSGPKVATTVAIVAVFTSTTLLHAYQWFWLRGSFHVPLNDVLFFGIFGGLVLVTALTRGRPGPDPSPFRRSFRAAGVFLLISILWAMWNSPSVAAWADVTWANRGEPVDWAKFVLLKLSPGVLVPPAARVALVSTLLLVATLPGVQKSFGPRLGSILATIDDDRFSQWDEDQVIHGYYEGLLAVNRLNSRAWERELAKPADEIPLRESEAVEHRESVPAYVLIPSREMPFRETTIRTNRWGMRDDDFEKRPAPGTGRIALLGSSYVMGWGVNHDEVFGTILEGRLNEDGPVPSVARWEVLNFAVGGYTLIDQVALVRDKVFEFEPGVVLFVSHTGMRARELERLAEYLAEGTHERSPILQELLYALEVDPSLSPGEIRSQLRAQWNRLLDWTNREIVEASRRGNAVPVFVLLPKIRQSELLAPDRRMLDRAREAGFETILLDGVYGDWDPAAIRIAPWDYHPNALGHRLIASRLFDELVASGVLIR